MRKIEEKEIQFILWIQNNIRNPIFNFLNISITIFGEAFLYWIVAGFLMFGPFDLQDFGYKLIWSLFLELLIVHIWLKPKINRNRPFEVSNKIIPLGRKPKDRSFPSGHTAVSFMFALLCFLQSSTVGVFSLAFAALIALSRIYLGVHYPTDVLGGFSIAIFINIIVNYL